MVDLWERLVSTESGTSDKEGVDKVCEMLKKELEKSNAVVNVVEMEYGGNLLRAEFHGERNEKPVLLIGHMDTVFAKGTLEKNPFRIDAEGKAHGPGILDMKAGLVIAVYILRALDFCGYEKRPVRVVFAGDEENGHRLTTAKEEIRKACEGCEAAFNFETGFLDDGIVVGRKGACQVTLATTGVAAHAGNDPQRGRSAILEMAYKILELQKLHDFEHGLFVNVGVIKGGTVPNAVPANCEIQIDIRYESRELLDKTIEKIREIAKNSFVPDTVTEFTMSTPSEVMEVSESNLQLFEHVKKAAELIGYGTLTTKKVGGWSDSCVAAACGIPVVCAMGVKGANNHSMEEFAVVDTLFDRTKLALASTITL
jgi:glutamate carboxypeptidase